MLKLFRLRPAEPDAICVHHDGHDYRVSIKRSDRAKRLTLRVHSASRDAVATAPRRIAFATIECFVQRHAGWLHARLSKLGEKTGYADGAHLPLRGEMVRLSARPDLRGAARLTDDVLAVPGEARFMARRVETFLRREALKDLTESTHRHAATLGVTIASITLRDTKSRWGSCSARGAMSYSWRLILAPPFVLDYLCAHEVAHRKEMNHSRKFWAIVHELCPRTDEAEVWLKKNGARLHGYGG